MKMPKKCVTLFMSTRFLNKWDKLTERKFWVNLLHLWRFIWLWIPNWILNRGILWVWIWMKILALLHERRFCQVIGDNLTQLESGGLSCKNGGRSQVHRDPEDPWSNAALRVAARLPTYSLYLIFSRIIRVPTLNLATGGACWPPPERRLVKTKFFNIWINKRSWDCAHRKLSCFVFTRNTEK